MVDKVKRREAFWVGFWAAFSHPVLVYGFGFAAGFVAHALLFR